MGTNYYACYNYCEHCKREDRLHICKLSLGYRPIFQAYKNEKFKIVSWRDWKDFLEKPGVLIKNEYGNLIVQDAFYKKIEEWQRHFEVTPRISNYDNDSFLNDEGYQFIWLEFF